MRPAPDARAEAGSVRPLVFEDGLLRILDQRALPDREEWLECREPDGVVEAIRTLAVRGAPALGIAGAFGVALAAGASSSGDREAVLADVRSAAARLAGARPTAVNLGWAVRRVAEAAARGADAGAVRREATLEAERILAGEERAMVAIAEAGAALVPDGSEVLTHCNTGALACGAGHGTAQGAIVAAHLSGKRIHVWVDETRPVLQGARLTAWELQRLGVPMTLIADAAAGHLMASGRVDLVIVGADRIAANGDVANKIGTYQLAVLARECGLPFYVAAPLSTIDPDVPTGADIPIESRDPGEVVSPRGVRFAPEGTPALNPAFDVTPARLVTAIVTDAGVIREPSGEGIRRVLESAGEEGP